MLNFLEKGQTRICWGSSSISTLTGLPGLSSSELCSSHSYMKVCAVFDEFKSTHTGLDLLWVATLWFPQVGHCRSPAKNLGFGGRICRWVSFCTSNCLPLLENASVSGNFMGGGFLDVKRGEIFSHVLETTLPNLKYTQIEKCQKTVTKNIHPCEYLHLAN